MGLVERVDVVCGRILEWIGFGDLESGLGFDVCENLSIIIRAHECSKALVLTGVMNQFVEILLPLLVKSVSKSMAWLTSLGTYVRQKAGKYVSFCASFICSGSPLVAMLAWADWIGQV